MEPTPINNELMHRFELSIDGSVAFLAYQEHEQGVLTFTHTYVPPALRGQNLAAILTRFALEDALHHGYRVVPQCTYTAAYLERHKEYAQLVAAAL